MLSDLVSSAKYPEVKRATEDREGWRTTDRRGMSDIPNTRTNTTKTNTCLCSIDITGWRADDDNQ